MKYLTATVNYLRKPVKRAHTALTNWVDDLLFGKMRRDRKIRQLERDVERLESQVKMEKLWSDHHQWMSDFNNRMYKSEAERSQKYREEADTYFKNWMTLANKTTKENIKAVTQEISERLELICPKKEEGESNE